MKTIIPDGEILDLLKQQLKNFAINQVEASQLEEVWPEALTRIEHCFNGSINKYFKHGDEAFLNPFHASQWCISLYIISRVAYEKEPDNPMLASKLYYLNRMLNGCDLFYEVKLPNVFYLDHPLGSIISRATIEDGFSFRQGCNVGHNKGIYPTIGKNVKMLANSKIIGDCTVGDNVILASGAIIMDCDVPSNTIVFGKGKDVVYKDNTGQYSFG